MSEGIIFSEAQSLKDRPALSFLLFIPPLLFVLGLLIYLITGKPVGDKPAPPVTFICAALIFGFIAVVTRQRVHLNLRIADDKIMYGWSLHTSNLDVVRMERVEKLAVINLPWYYGAGYKFSFSGTYLSLGSKFALEITLKSKDRIVIGTRKPELLQSALNQLKIEHPSLFAA